MAGGNWYRAGPGPKIGLSQTFSLCWPHFKNRAVDQNEPSCSIIPDFELNTSFHSLDGPSRDGIFLRHFSLSSYLRIWTFGLGVFFWALVKVAVCCKWETIWSDNEKNLESDTQNSNNKIIFSTISRVFTLKLDAIYDSLLRNYE